jgi:hypothetical protein
MVPVARPFHSSQQLCVIGYIEFTIDNEVKRTLLVNPVAPPVNGDIAVFRELEPDDEL